jgi:hypothetical protein
MKIPPELSFWGGINAVSKATLTDNRLRVTITTLVLSLALDTALLGCSKSIPEELFHLFMGDYYN